MDCSLVKDVIELYQKFDAENRNTQRFEFSVDGFKNWIIKKRQDFTIEPYWENKENGRSADSVINTLIAHVARYVKLYYKSAMYDSDISTQEDFMYLFHLKEFGEMGKMELIRKKCTSEVGRNADY